jgi:hypothetical protein
MSRIRNNDKISTKSASVLSVPTVGFNVEKFKSKPPIHSYCLLCSTCTLVSQLIGTIITNKYYFIALFIYNSRFVKGIGSPDEYFLKAYAVKSVLAVYAQMVFNSLPALLKRKINSKFLLDSWKTLTISKGSSESCIWLFHLLVDFL